MKPLFTDNEWNFDRLHRTWEVINDIAKNRYGLDYYPPQIEVISSTQMLQAYCSDAMPIMYNHWSFGKKYAKLIEEYDQGIANLAYEIVINTNPCLAYLMESNSMVMQTLVMAHACCGHGSFFKTNYLFKEHTNANSILDYLRFAKDYIAEAEKKYGLDKVETLIDKCRSLQYQSVDRYPRKYRTEEDRLREKAEREAIREKNYNHLFDFKKTKKTHPDKRKRKWLKNELPEDNLLYFIEKHSLVLEEWEKEIVHIIRNISQYFYPQILTKVGNEGCASFWHYTIMTDLCNEGYLTEGHRLEFLKSHCNVISQIPYNSMYYSGRNPYTIGFAIYQDIRRICENPTKEDKEYMPNVAGGDWLETIKDLAASYKDSELIANFMSPKVVKDLKLFVLDDKEEKLKYKVEWIHDKKYFIELRREMSKQYQWDYMIPSLNITHFDPTQPLVTLVHKDYKGRDLEGEGGLSCLENFQALMGCDFDYKP